MTRFEAQKGHQTDRKIYPASTCHMAISGQLSRIDLPKIMNFDAELITLGLLCPLPVLKARKRLREMPEGAVLRLVSDDPISVIDVPFFCSEAGHSLLAKETIDQTNTFYIGKGTPKK